MSRRNSQSLFWGNQSSKCSSQQPDSHHLEFLLMSTTLPRQFLLGRGLETVLPPLRLSSTRTILPRLTPLLPLC
jgi:hypothetical protein